MRLIFDVVNYIMKKKTYRRHAIIVSIVDGIT